MRDIIFRGKRIDNGEWVYGFLLFDAEQNEAYIAEYFEDKAAYLKKVIPETVGQYTGLKDINGKMIFEGDIVKEEYEVFVSARVKEKRVRIGYVEYESNSLCCRYYAYFWNDKKKWRGNFAIHCGCEIIGNIHDNPELLKGGD